LKGWHEGDFEFNSYLVPEQKLGFFVKIKEDENFNHPSTICRTYGTGRNTGSISRIYPPPNLGGLKFESDADIGEKDGFSSGTI